MKIYEDNVSKFILENNQYIPRKIKPDEHLKLYHRYFSIFDSLYFKVDKIYNVFKTEYYSVKYPNFMYGEISYPIQSEYIYEFFLDKKNIKNISDIVNSRKSYLGAEIKYWFFINNIDLSEESKHYGFKSFLELNSKSTIQDDKYYFLYGHEKENKYLHCKIVVDKKKEAKNNGRK